MMIYAGIGSRKTPKEVLEVFRSYAIMLADLGFTLRSGGAEGADSAFENGCDLACGKKEIYLPWKNFNGNKSSYCEPTKEAMVLSEKCHPKWQYLKDGAKKLHARNAHQVLGIDLDSPVDFILCWTTESGGTNQALRIAKRYRKKAIPIFNFMTENYKINDILKTVHFQCERCGRDGAKIIPAMTRYPFEGRKNSPEDPNRNQILCWDCEEEYRDYWQELWNEYYAGQGLI